jgi:DNA-directed RNA polymerase specialized sigma24 family protein
MEESVTERLKDVNWDDLLPRLLLYTASLLRSYNLKDISAEDIVHSSITDLFSGQRILPTNLPLSTALMGIARSKISHEWQRERHRREVHLSEKQLFELEGEPLDIEGIEFREAILQRVRGDADLTRMVEAILEGPYLRSTELAERLGVSIEEVYNLKKRLKRKLRSNL